jgi:hypothetical protein
MARSRRSRSGIVDHALSGRVHPVSVFGTDGAKMLEVPGVNRLRSHLGGAPQQQRVVETNAETNADKCGGQMRGQMRGDKCGGQMRDKCGTGQMRGTNAGTNAGQYTQSPFLLRMRECGTVHSITIFWRSEIVLSVVNNFSPPTNPLNLITCPTHLLIPRALDAISWAWQLNQDPKLPCRAGVDVPERSRSRVPTHQNCETNPGSC